MAMCSRFASVAGGCLRQPVAGRGMMRHVRSVFMTVGLLSLLVCGGLLMAWTGRGPAAQTPLPVFGDVPAFSLINQSGVLVDRDALRGSVWIAEFIFTRCAGQCPLMAERLAELQRHFAREPRVRFVSITVDPAHDTPEALTAYARRYHADLARWSFLTGEAAAIQTLAQEGFRLGLSDGGSAREPIIHSVKLVLVDQAGRIRGYYGAMEARAVERLNTEVAALVRAAHAP